MTGIAVGYSKAQTVDEALAFGTLYVYDDPSNLDYSNLEITSTEDVGTDPLLGVWGKTIDLPHKDLFKSINNPETIYIHLRNNIQPVGGYEGPAYYDMEVSGLDGSAVAQNINVVVSSSGDPGKDYTEYYNGSLANFTGLGEGNYIPVGIFHPSGDETISNYISLTVTYSIIDPSELGSDGYLYYELLFSEVI